MGSCLDKGRFKMEFSFFFFGDEKSELFGAKIIIFSIRRRIEFEND